MVHPVADVADVDAGVVDVAAAADKEVVAFPSVEVLDWAPFQVVLYVRGLS